MVTRLLPVLLFAWILGEASAQTSRVLPWRGSDLTLTSPAVIAYHPEPIIFVHGISSSRLNWENVVSNLHAYGWFQAYHYNAVRVERAYESFDPPQEGYQEWQIRSKWAGQWRAFEQPYLHTWNYGRHARVGSYPSSTINTNLRVQVYRQTHDYPLEYNASNKPTIPFSSFRQEEIV